MELRDWLTNAASLVVGLGSSFLTAYTSSRRARSQADQEKRRVLRSYERALVEIGVKLDYAIGYGEGHEYITTMPEKHASVWHEAWDCPGFR